MMTKPVIRTDLDSVISAVNDNTANKVDKVTGKGLSTEDYTSAEKTKLAGVEEGAEVNTVESVANKTGVVTLDKSDVGLGNVDNTSDANKPISTATQGALDNKVDKVTGKGLSTEDYTSAEKAQVAKVGDLDTLTTTEKSNLVGSINEVGADLVAHKAETMLQNKIKGTTQTITFNSDGTVQKIEHLDVLDIALRTDTFVYSTSLITEVRTLSTGQTLTLKHHLDTFETEVI